MKESTDRYISLLTDFGFKRVFGTEMNKELLMGFLNALFEGEQVVKDVQYLNSGSGDDVLIRRSAIYDICCVNERGEKFIVEMQSVYQRYSKDSSPFYATYSIRESERKRSDWDFHVNQVYVVALLLFDLGAASIDVSGVTNDILLLNKDNRRVSYDKLTLRYVEVAKFNKRLEDLETLYDKWLYVLKNLSRLMERPRELQEDVFVHLFVQMEISWLTPAEQCAYERSLNVYRDIKNSMDTAWEQGVAMGREEIRTRNFQLGFQQGRAEALVEMARTMKADGLAPQAIANYTGLSAEEIERL